MARLQQSESQKFNYCNLARNAELIELAFASSLRFNQLSQYIELKGETIDLCKFRLDVAKDLGLSISREDMQDIVMAIASDESRIYHPIREYLESTQRELGGDTKYLDDLCSRFLGQTDPLFNKFLKYTLIGAVARIYKPGCQLDTTLILQGGQGSFKSTFFKVLASPEWFDDSLGAVSDKDERLKLHRSWFIEWAELESVFKRKDISTVKAFLTCSTDLVRRPYGRQIESLKRQSIIVGTTNKEEFLVDPTGNRRFWIIPVAKRIDIDRLKKERDLIWASAVTLYKQGHPWHLDEPASQQAEMIAQEFMSDDPWTDKIICYLRDKSSVSIPEILDHLELDNSQQTKSSQMRIADVLKKIGWTKDRRTIGGKLCRIWVGNPTDKTQSLAQ